MRTKKDWKKWFNSLNDSDISNILDKKQMLSKTSIEIDNKIHDMILKSKTIGSKKTEHFQFTKKNVLSYSLSFASLIIIFITIFMISKFYFIPYLNKLNKNLCIVENVNDKVYAIDNKNKIKLLKVNDIINQNTIVKSEINSNIKLKINNRHSAVISENTFVNINKLYKDSKKETDTLYLKIGKIDFTIDALNKGSVFKTETDRINVEVIGTKYSVEVKDKQTIIIVEDGTVFVQPKINIKKLIRLIKKIDKILSTDSEKSLVEKYPVGKNKIIIIDDEKLIEIDKALKIFTDKINEYSESNKKSSEEFNKTKVYIEEETKRIKKMILELTQPKELTSSDIEKQEEAEIKFNCVKVSNIANVNFTILNTAVTSDGLSMFVACDTNASLYSVDIKTGRLNWIFKDLKITDITSPVYPYKDMLILATPENIFVLGKTGKLKNIFTLKKGVSYWASPVIINNNLYIPTTNGIQIFNGEFLKPLENINEIDGQLYISNKDSYLYILNSIEQKIKIIDLLKNEKIWETNKINNRLFCPPLVYNNYLYITDLNSSIYRFDINDKNNFQSINLNTGTLSNIIFYNNTAYFTANNGYFYSVNLKSFDKFNKLQQIDNLPSYDLYLTKKGILFKDKIFFNSDRGQLFCHDIKSGKNIFVNVSANSLIGSPIIHDKSIYVIDEKANIFKITEQ